MTIPESIIIVIIFSKGKIRKYKPFSFGNKAVDVVENYVYLGVTFNYNGKFNKAKAKQVLQGKKAHYIVISKVKQHNMPVDVFTELFERIAISVLLYGSEIWGYEGTEHLQVIFNNIMMGFLRCLETTPVCMINGELGLKEII